MRNFIRTKEYVLVCREGESTSYLLFDTMDLKNGYHEKRKVMRYHPSDASISSQSIEGFLPGYTAWKGV